MLAHSETHISTNKTFLYIKQSLKIIQGYIFNDFCRGKKTICRKVTQIIQTVIHRNDSYILWTCRFTIWKSGGTELHQHHYLILSLYLKWEQTVYYTEIPIKNKDSSTVFKRTENLSSRILYCLYFPASKFLNVTL